MTAIAKTGRIVAVVLISTILTGCGSKTAYLHFESLPSAEWHQDSVLTFAIAPCDTSASYDILFHIRHTNAYPYQNMWLFVTGRQGDRQQTDTLELYLADDRGAWLGNGRNGLTTMPVIYDEHRRIGSDTLYLMIQQGMRDSVLGGVQDVGVEAIKIEN